jgi:hypothetical protein
MDRVEAPDPLRPVVEDLAKRGGNVISIVVDADGNPLSSTSTTRPDVPMGEVEVTVRRAGDDHPLLHWYQWA